MSIKVKPGIKINYAFNPNLTPVPAPIKVASSSSSSIASIASSSSKYVSNASWGTLFCNAVSRWISDTCFYFRSFSYETINPNANLEQLSKTYFGLKADKWKECIDAKYHHLGKDVFALGLHNNQKYLEPGYVPSMEKAFEFCAKYLNKKVDADWYLELHKYTCEHFDGDPEVYLMGQEKVGVFRCEEDGVQWWPSAPNYEPTPEAIQELADLDAEVKREFGPEYGMGKIAIDPATKCWLHSYHKMTRSQMKQVFNKFMNEFYVEVERAANQDQKINAIAKLNKRLELLHPPKDGSGRTNTAMINKILTDYGSHPALLDNPFVSTTYGLARWTEYFKAGLRQWEAVRR